MSTWWRSFVSGVRRRGERPPAAFTRRLASRIGHVSQEFQILLGDEEAREDLVAAPLEKQRLPRKRSCRRFHARKCDFYNASDRRSQRLGEPVDVPRLETCAPGVCAGCQQGKIQTIAC